MGQRKDRRLTDYKGLERMYNPEQLHTGNTWWYVVAKHEGRALLLGPYSDEQSANTTAMSKINGPYEVVSSKTRDRAKMTQQVRHMILSDTSDIGQALRRMKHTI